MMIRLSSLVMTVIWYGPDDGERARSFQAGRAGPWPARQQRELRSPAPPLFFMTRADDTAGSDRNASSLIFLKYYTVH